MLLRPFIAAVLLAASVTAPLSASAQDALTGDTKLACEAILCLASPTRPQECTAAIAKYFSISLKRFSRTMQARKNFLSLCPRVDQATVDHVATSNPPEPDPPPPPPPPPEPDPVPPLTKAQIEARIAELVPIWEAQVALSVASYKALEECVLREGRVQDGFCQRELADHSSKSDPAKATRDEIYRLQALLAEMK